MKRVEDYYSWRNITANIAIVFYPIFLNIFHWVISVKIEHLGVLLFSINWPALPTPVGRLYVVYGQVSSAVMTTLCSLFPASYPSSLSLGTCSLAPTAFSFSFLFSVLSLSLCLTEHGFSILFGLFSLTGLED